MRQVNRRTYFLGALAGALLAALVAGAPEALAQLTQTWGSNQNANGKTLVNLGSLEVEGGTAGHVELAAGSTAAVSGAARGRLRFNEGSSLIESSLNGAAYATVPSGGGAANRVATWSGAGSLSSSANWTYDGSVVTLSGREAITQPASGSGTPSPALTVTGAAHTGITAGAEVVAVDLAINQTRTWATGALATQRSVLVRQPTLAFAGASTVTDAATVAIAGAPVAGANATISNPYALWTQAGNVRFDGSVGVGRAPLFALDVAGSASTVGLITQATGDALGGLFAFRKARGSLASEAIVQNNDVLGTLSAGGYDGGAYRTAGYVRVIVDGAPGGSDMPGRIEVATTADGAAFSTLRWVVNNAGHLMAGATNAYDVGSSADGAGTGAVRELFVRTVDTPAGVDLTFQRANANALVLGATSAAFTQSVTSAGTANVLGGTTQVGSGVLTVIGQNAIVATDGVVDTSTKTGRIASAHYTNSEEPLSLILGNSAAATSIVFIGGGSSVLNAATELRFYTAANNTTVTGTQRFTIDANGNVVAGALAALATGATNGDLYIPTSAGAPTGDTTDFTGKVPLRYDTTNDKLCVNTSGATWKCVTLAP